MTALIGTVVSPVRWEAGETFTSIGCYTLAAPIADTDTITWTGLIPNGGVRIDSIFINSVELDTHATPTATAIFGDAGDTDRFMSASGVGLAAADQTRVILSDNRAYSLANGVGAGYVYSATAALILTINAAVATAASAGDMVIKVTYTCVGNA